MVRGKRGEGVFYLRAVPGNSCSLEGFHLLGSSRAKPSPLKATNPVVLVALAMAISKLCAKLQLKVKT